MKGLMPPVILFFTRPKYFPHHPVLSIWYSRFILQIESKWKIQNSFSVFFPYVRAQVSQPYKTNCMEQSP